MCGIAGIFHTNANQPISPELLVNMAAIQQHRGPDGFGYHILKKHGIGFSHARLSIIDLDNNRAKQPFVTPDQSLLLAHNGEFYDYQSIRAELTAQGAQFQSKSDSEIILHLYPRLGLLQTLEQLRGEFAFSLYDASHDTLYLVRDRFGIKPLYWTKTHDGIIFGSELKVLFAHPAVQRAFSPTGLYHQLMQTMVPGTTAFENIHQVKPGHVIKISRQGAQLTTNAIKYWDINFPHLKQRQQMSEAEAITETRNLLVNAVSHRLEADVPVGCYLSGGIDSCSILGLAAAARQQPVKAFTIGFDDDQYDESGIAQIMAKSCQADQDILRLSGLELYDFFVTTLWHTERTIYNTLGVAKFLMSRHVNQAGYKVVLTGEGSDELFGGYPAFRNDMMLHGLQDLSQQERQQWQQMLLDSNKIFQGAMLSSTQVDNDALNQLIGFTPSCLQPWLDCAKSVPDLLAPHYRKQLESYCPGQAIAEALDGDQICDRHALDKAQYVWIKTMLEGQILTWGGDRVDMANSMEARPPFLDHKLAEFAVQIPPELRIRGRTEKYVLREAMKGLLPEVLYKREKFAFMAPPAHTQESKWQQMQQLAQTYLSASAIEATGLLSHENVQKLFQRHNAPNVKASEQVQLDAIINHLIGVQVLHHHFIATDIPMLAAEKAKNLGWHPKL